MTVALAYASLKEHTSVSNHLRQDRSNCSQTNTSRAFTLIELLVAVAIIAVLMAIMLPVFNRIRENGKRAVCFGNLRQLQLAWTMYADDNAGRIVNGDAGDIRFWGPLANEKEPAWVGKCTLRTGLLQHANLPQVSQRVQEQEIKRGALWPYVGELGTYRCPTAMQGEMLTYAISSGMNGGPDTGTCKMVGARPVPKREDGVWLWLKIRSQIQRPVERMVFIDEGWTTIGPYAVHYVTRTWWDGPPFNHGDGATMTFADGHIEHWKWQGIDTIKIGRQARDPSMAHLHHDFIPESEAGYQDLWRMQRATWGKLGYQPDM